MKQLDGAPTGTTGWQILAIVAGAPAIPRALNAPMFGRQGELTRLRSAFRRVVRSGTIERLTVIGDAGIGKSRLAREFVSSIGTDAWAITQRCPARSEGVAFLPVRDAVVEAAGLLGWNGLHRLLANDHDGEHVAPEIATAIGLRAEAESVAFLFPAVRRLLAALASHRPLIVVLEDLHWAEPTFLDLVDYLVRETTEPILLLCLARPDLIEERPDWDSTEVVELERLSTADVQNLVVDRRESLGPDVVRRIVETSEGEPALRGQLLVALDDDPARGHSRLAPRTPHHAARPPRTRRARPAPVRVDRRAPIRTGRRVRAASADALPYLERHLETMTQRRFIQRTGPTTFRFGHALIRMAAYHSIARDDRAALHHRFAEWLTDGVA